MDFKKFTKDAKIIITKLETYGLSCLTAPMSRESEALKSITKDGKQVDDLCVFSEPKNWKEFGALSALRDLDNKWAFQLNLIHPSNQMIYPNDILIGFIMLPKSHTTNMIDNVINAKIYLGDDCINTFQFSPFRFVPAIENTYFFTGTAHYKQIKIGFNKNKNYDIYYLKAYLQNRERAYCLQTDLEIPISEEYYCAYVRGFMEIYNKKHIRNPNINLEDYDLTSDKPFLPIPNLPFDEQEFVDRTFHPNRALQWCYDIDEQKDLSL